jgi:hypothetical protein
MLVFLDAYERGCLILWCLADTGLALAAQPLPAVTAENVLLAPYMFLLQQP